MASESSPSSNEAAPVRPSLPQQRTSLTFVSPASQEASGLQQQDKRPNSDIKAEEQSVAEETQANGALIVEVEAPSAATLLSRRIHDIFLLVGILTMLAWPWVFWGIVRSLGGVKMRNSHAKVVRDHPQSSAFFVSLVGNFVSLVVDVFFSLAVIRFAQEWVSDRAKVSVFHVSLLGAFRHQSFPWTIDDLKTLIRKNKWLPVSLVGFCILSFQFVPSGTTSLLLPVPFNRTEPLLGRELDFSSTAGDCLGWLNAISFDNDCDWHTFKNVSYTSCFGQNQLLDVLAAGRSSLLSLVLGNTESLSLNQLGAKDGMRLVGPLHGILPLGPNGVPAFDTLEPSAFTNPDTLEAMLAYNYTLQYQGLSSTIKCGFDTTTQVQYARIEGDESEEAYALVYNGTCPQGANFLADRGVDEILVPNSANGLGYWACREPFTEGELPSYSVYLRGQRGTSYEESIGNMTCHISPLQLSTYPVTYQSEPRLFKSENGTTSAQTVYLGLIEQALLALSGVVKESQSSEANLVVEAIITAGVKSFGYASHGRDARYLSLFERMIEGMLDYEVAYSRLLYSAEDSPPSSCMRQVPGEVSYTVFGWSAELAHIGYLMPMTLLNLAALGIILAAIIITKPGVLDLTDPTHPLHMLQTVSEEEGQRPSHWGHSVSFRRSSGIEAASARAQEQVAVVPPAGVVMEVGKTLFE